MTNGDRIRSMTDNELAVLLTGLFSTQRKTMLRQLQQAGVAENIVLSEMPALTMVAHLEWLKQPWEGDHEC